MDMVAAGYQKPAVTCVMGGISQLMRRQGTCLVSKGVPCTRTGLLSLKLVAGLLMPETCGEAVSLADNTKPGVTDFDLVFS